MKNKLRIIISSLVLLLTFSYYAFGSSVPNHSAVPDEVLKNIEASKNINPSNFILAKIANPKNPNWYVEVIPYTKINSLGELRTNIRLKNKTGDKLIACVPINSIWDEPPVAWLDDSRLLLNFNQIYNINTEQFENLTIPITIWNASLSPDKTKIGYIGKGADNKISVLYYDIERKTSEFVYTVEPSEWGLNLEPIVYVDWGKNDQLFFDAPARGKPQILMYNLTEKTVATIVKEARIPRVSDDGLVLSYLKSDVYNGNGTIKKETVIKQLTTGKTNAYPWYKRVLFDKTKIAIVGLDDIKIESRNTLDEQKVIPVEGDVMFARFNDGVLEYTEVNFQEGELKSVKTQKK